MVSREKVYALVIKDMTLWVRQPFLIGIAVIPLIIISLLGGVFISSAESVPAGVVIQDDDTTALEIKDYIVQMKSGTGLPWFTIDQDLTPQEVVDQYNNGDILCYIIIPAGITEKLHNNDNIVLHVKINNINDDITKNVMQRMEYVCNHFNRDLTIKNITYHAPDIDFIPITDVDITFTYYLVASVLSLTVLLTSGVNAAVSAAREFEEATAKELLMGGSPLEIVIGKNAVSLLQTIICFVIISAVVYAVYGFLPKGNVLIISFFVVWGCVCFSGLGVIAASRLKHTIPAAIIIIVLNIGGWYIGGGLVPSEVWTGVIGTLAELWPGTYFFSQFNNLTLLGAVQPALLVRDLLITGSFGVICFLVGAYTFIKEVKTC